MDFISNQEHQIQEMMKVLGIATVEELFVSVPKALMVARPSEDDGLSEFEGMRLMESLAAKNSFVQRDNYLGAGAYEHHVPALVGAICSKSEFLTAYTPYQPEASQGMLQAIFEFQSAICALTGMDAANASVYDAASACAEALLMSLRHHKERNRILVASSVHPHYRAVIEQYLCSHATEIVLIPHLEDGTLDREAFESLLNDKTAAVLIQNPNFFGVVEDLKELFASSKKEGCVNVLCADPISYGLYESAATQGADVAVGDCQPFGIPLQFGGPYAGYMACKQEFLRQMPGRIVGETVDTEGKRGFVLTLQAREQHIRREKATSNICTNQALAALASLVAMLWYGKEGVRKLALTNYQRTAYLRDQLKAIPGITISSADTFFNEFVVRFEASLPAVLEAFRASDIEPGLELNRYYPDMPQQLLVAVTETKSRQQLDRFLNVARQIHQEVTHG